MNDQRKNEIKKNPNKVIVEIFAAGDGVHYPKKGNTVILHYSAFLRDENGEMFDCVSLLIVVMLQSNHIFIKKI